MAENEHQWLTLIYNRRLFAKAIYDFTLAHAGKVWGPLEYAQYDGLCSMFDELSEYIEDYEKDAERPSWFHDVINKLKEIEAFYEGYDTARDDSSGSDTPAGEASD